MREMKEYCVGKSTKGVVFFLLILLVIMLFVYVFAVYKNKSILDNLIVLMPYMRTVLTCLVIGIIIKFILGTKTNLKKRFDKCIKKFKQRGILSYVIDDFKNGVLFFRNGNVKIGQLCLFLKEEGWIFLYEEISSVRMNIVKESYESGGGFDGYVPQICVDGKYYNLGSLKTDLNDPQWTQFVNYIRLKAPHITIESTPYVTYQPSIFVAFLICQLVIYTIIHTVLWSLLYRFLSCG